MASGWRKVLLHQRWLAYKQLRVLSPFGNSLFCPSTVGQSCTNRTVENFKCWHIDTRFIDHVPSLQIEGLGYQFPNRTLPFSFIFFIGKGFTLIFNRVRESEVVSIYPVLTAAWSVAILLENLYSLDFVTRYNLDRYFPLLTRTEVYKTGVTHYFSIEKARKELGYVPRTNPNDLSQVIAMYQSTPEYRKRLAATKTSMKVESLLNTVFNKFVFLFVALLLCFGFFMRSF